MKPNKNAPRDRETFLVTQIASGISIVSFLVYLGRGELLLYGDAVAHINIARRVFDSQTPGLLQLGTVWLPLPHLLMLPFLISNPMWQTGMGGSIPSMVAYILAVAGIFRLTRNTLKLNSQSDYAVRALPWFAAAIYALNPNLLYLQSIAMTEPLYLAFFVWTVVHFGDFVQEIKDGNNWKLSSSLTKCGWCLAGACLTRYDGWVLAATICVLVVILSVHAKPGGVHRATLSKFILLTAAAPALWFAYNTAVYHNPLEFANGPYSAKAIEKKTVVPGVPSHPGANDLPVAFSFFLKSAEENLAPGNIAERLWIALLLMGVIAAALLMKWECLAVLLLLLPVPFYALSIAYGAVPIFLPTWWPHSYYNLRYGLELLPAFAIFLPLVMHFLIGRSKDRSYRTAVLSIPLLLVAGSYVSIWRQQPVCLLEARINSKDRIALENELAATLRKLPRDSTLLMYTGDHVGSLQGSGIALSHVINEGNHRPWKKPSDPDGLWERALQNPRQYADFIVATEGDQVDSQVNKAELSSMVVIHSSGEPFTTIYWTHRAPR